MMRLDSTTMALALGEPPRDAVAQYPISLLIGSIVVAVITTVVGAVWAYRNRSMVWLVSFLACSTIFPFFCEPFGDRFLHVWFPLNHPMAIWVLERPMPWWGICFYIAVFPTAIVLAYEMAKRVSPAKLLIWIGLVFGVAEVGFEAVGNHLGWIMYYDNPATVLGVPIYCLPQNGGLFIVFAWTLAVVLPKTHGWRWALIPFVLAGFGGAFVLAATWPAYLALGLDASDAVIWVAAIIATVFNAAGVVWCAYSPQLKRLREVYARAPQPAAATRPADLSGVS